MKPPSKPRVFGGRELELAPALPALPELPGFPGCSPPDEFEFRDEYNDDVQDEEEKDEEGDDHDESGRSATGEL